MTIFYSGTTGGFYHEDVHTHIPDDAVPISDADHMELLNAQVAGARIQPDENGRPVAGLAPAPSVDELTRRERRRRDALLRACDARVLPDFPQTADECDAWKVYRQALRELTDQPGFPATVVWPPVPEAP